MFFVDFLQFLESLNKDALVDPVFCPNDCGRSYKGKSRKYVLKRHVMYECLTPPQFPCSVCRRPFKRKDEMLMHQQKKHNNFEWCELAFILCYNISTRTAIKFDEPVMMIFCFFYYFYCNYLFGTFFMLILFELYFSISIRSNIRNAVNKLLIWVLKARMCW